MQASWVFEEKLFFCYYYYYLFFANGFLCGEDCAPAQPPEHHSKD